MSTSALRGVSCQDAWLHLGRFLDSLSRFLLTYLKKMAVSLVFDADSRLRERTTQGRLASRHDSRAATGMTRKALVDGGECGTFRVSALEPGDDPCSASYFPHPITTSLALSAVGRGQPAALQLLLIWVQGRVEGR